MSAAPAPPTTPPDQKEQKVVTVPSWVAGGGVAAIVTGVFSFLWLLLFHAGAAYLSYKTFGSGLWALLDFFFPYFYYPYYAFALHTPATQPVLFGGMKKMLKRK